VEEYLDAKNPLYIHRSAYGIDIYPGSMQSAIYRY
jgi:hypothetical protein